MIKRRISKTPIGAEITKNQSQQICQKKASKYAGFDAGKLVNGSVALSYFLFVAKNWQQGALSLILGSDRKGVTQ